MTTPNRLIRYYKRIERLMFVPAGEQWVCDSEENITHEIEELKRENERLRKMVITAKEAFDDIGAETLSELCSTVLPNKESEHG